MPAPLVAVAAAALPVAKELGAALTHPLFRLELAAVKHVGRGKRAYDMPIRFALQPSVLDVGVGAAAVIAAWAFFNWSKAQGGPDSLSWDPIFGFIPSIVAGLKGITGGAMQRG